MYLIDWMMEADQVKLDFIPHVMIKLDGRQLRTLRTFHSFMLREIFQILFRNLNLMNLFH